MQKVNQSIAERAEKRKASVSNAADGGQMAVGRKARKKNKN